MAIEVRCSHCGKAIRVVDTMAGSYGKCLCGNPIYVPRPIDESDELESVPVGRQATAEAGAATKLEPLDALLDEGLSPATGETSSFDPWSRFTSGRKRKKISLQLGTTRWSIRSVVLVGSLVAAVVVGLGCVGYFVLTRDLW